MGGMRGGDRVDGWGEGGKIDGIEGGGKDG